MTLRRLWHMIMHQSSGADSFNGQITRLAREALDGHASTATAAKQSHNLCNSCHTLTMPWS